VDRCHGPGYKFVSGDEKVRLSLFFVLKSSKSVKHSLFKYSVMHNLCWKEGDWLRNTGVCLMSTARRENQTTACLDINFGEKTHSYTVYRGVRYIINLTPFFRREINISRQFSEKGGHMPSLHCSPPPTPSQMRRTSNLCSRTHVSTLPSLSGWDCAR
jgi:hypothetical protein